MVECSRGLEQKRKTLQERLRKGYVKVEALPSLAALEYDMPEASSDVIHNNDAEDLPRHVF